MSTGESSPEVSLNFGIETAKSIIGDTMPSTEVLASLVGDRDSQQEVIESEELKIKRAQTQITRLRGMITLHEKDISIATDITKDCTEQQRLIDSNIQALTNRAGDEEYLQSSLGIASAEPERTDWTEVDKLILHYIAAKLFGRGDHHEALRVLNEQDLPEHDRQSQKRKMDVVRFMYTKSESSPRGVGLPYLIMQTDGELPFVNAGTIDGFMLIGSTEDVQRKYPRLPIVKLSDKMKHNSCMLMPAKNQYSEDPNPLLLTTDYIVHNPEEASDRSISLLQASENEEDYVVTGKEAIQSTVETLSQQAISGLFKERARDLLIDTALTLFDSGVNISMLCTADIVLPESHCNQAIRSVIDAVAEDISTMLIDDQRIYVSSVRGEEQRLMKKDLTKLRSKFGGSYTSSLLDIGEHIYKAADSVAGSGFSDIYLRPISSDLITSAIIAHTEGFARAKSDKSTEQETIRIITICEHLKQRSLALSNEIVVSNSDVNVDTDSLVVKE